MPASKPEPPTLDEFAEGRDRPRGSFLDTLPEDVKAQLMGSPAAPRIAAEWLHTLGHTRATSQMVYEWRRRNGFNLRS